MRRKVRIVTTDNEAEAFLDQELSDLDFSQFKPVRFEFAAKSALLNMRVPEALLKSVKQRAKAIGIPYTRYIRQLMEEAVTTPQRRADAHFGLAGVQDRALAAG